MRRGLWLLAVLAAFGMVLVGPHPAKAGVVRPFALGYHDTIYGDFTTIGNAVLGCPAGNAACAGAQQRTTSAGNNSFDMRYVHADPSVGRYDSSTSEVTIPAGASIAYARLSWAGNTGTYKLGRNTLQRCDASHGNATLPAGSPERQQVSVRVGSGSVSPVAPGSVSRDPDSDGGPHYYTAEADVTSLLSGAPTGSATPVTVGDIWAPTGYGCIGGWSLTVVYRYDHPTAQAPHKRAVYLYSGHVVQRSQDAPTTVRISGFRATDVADIRAGVVAYEGDWNVPGSRFAVNDRQIPNPETGARSKFFDSSADGTVDPDVPNNMSVDAKAFTIPRGIIEPGDESAALTFSTNGDTYLPQQLAFSVPVPDVQIEKKADVSTAGPGDAVTYTVTIRNISDAPHPDVSLRDDLSDVLDDASFDGTVTTDGGHADYDAPTLSWRGAVPAHTTYHLKYQVIVRHKAAGDGTMRNVVVSSDPSVGCPSGADDPRCSASVARRASAGHGGSSGHGGTSDGSSGELPSTGSGAGRLALAGMLAVLGGVVLVVVGYRRFARHR